MVHGSQEQRREHVARIARAETVWCNGSTEPGAGSDLASLQCRAVADGDDYVVSGQKVFTTNAHRAGWCFLLARTNPHAPKHRGLSCFIVDMKSPGITVHPVWLMAGGRVNEVFFDEVRVPKGNLVGEEDRGWYVAMTTLGFERSGIENIAEARRTLDDLVEYVKVAMDNRAARHRLVELRVEVEVGRMIAYRVAWMQDQGYSPDWEASLSRLYGSELRQRLTCAGMELLGLYSQLQDGSPRAILSGRVEHSYRGTVVNTIAGGTSEIQRNIIATRGLGLPRD
jgi:alkylation response protein AidB-like acyl-CoA dehydrogenase